MQAKVAELIRLVREQKAMAPDPNGFGAFFYAAAFLRGGVV